MIHPKVVIIGSLIVDDNNLNLNFDGLINYSVVSIPGLDVPYPVLLKTENIGILIICAIVVSVFSSYLGALASKKIS